MKGIIMPPWTEQRQTVFLDRYALRDAYGNHLEHDPKEMFQRVGCAVAEGAATTGGVSKEELAQSYIDLMTNWQFIPGGRVLAGVGTTHKVTYYNCYVIPVEVRDKAYGNDSRQGIMDTIAAMSEISSRGGGIGINWSVLRPAGAYVRGVNGISSGAVSWMKVANEVSRQVTQGGTRRAALMFVLEDWHPDLLEFIKVKDNLNELTHANLSVGISDDFMQAVKDNASWTFEFPDTSIEDYDKLWDGNIRAWKAQGLPIKKHKTMPARELFNLITEHAWRTGEPGLVFLERYNKQSNLAYCERIISTNPCGEQGLPPWGVCNLGALNLAAFQTARGTFDFAGLRHATKLAVRFLDTLIDLNYYFIPQIEEQAKSVRRIGLGTMGLADLLIMNEMHYMSTQAVATIRAVYETIRNTAYQTSVELAKESEPFPLFDAKEYCKAPFIQNLPEPIRENIAKCGIRNGVLLTQAPTGTTSILAGVSSGIEPNFDFEYVRTDRTGTHVVKHWLAQKYFEEHGANATLPPYFVKASDLTPEEHVRIQALIQQYTDSSISKTVNAPKEHTVEEVRKLYQLAYDTNCKGITYYRDGSREGVLHHMDAVSPKKRPRQLKGITEVVETPTGRLYITANSHGGKLFELFATIGKAGSDIAAFTEAIARLISQALRSGIEPQEIADQLKGIGGSSTVGFGNNKIASVPDALGKFIRRYLEAQSGKLTEPTAAKSYDLCPSCGVYAYEKSAGCSHCNNCGHSAC